jgi:hypothetical protein
MARKNGCGPLVILGLVGLAIYAASSGLSVGAWIAIGVVVLVLAAVAASPKKCQLCGSAIQKKSYKINDGSRTLVVCASCGRKAQSRISKNAVDGLFQSNRAP